MTKDEEINVLKSILHSIEYIEYEDPEEGLVIFCPVCGGTPEREKLNPRVRAMYPSLGGKGHEKNCRLDRALSARS